MKKTRYSSERGTALVEYVVLMGLVSLMAAPSIWHTTGKLLKPMCITNTAIKMNTSPTKLSNSAGDGILYYFVFGDRSWTPTFDSVCYIKVRLAGNTKILYKVWDQAF
ncbi:MAG: hypothetical protein KDD70_01205 [Bdellovibrionales bacterium]|nr:hypothetical protein [Bdellovibrionales bacterium]